MKKIVYSEPSGNVVVIHPAPKEKVGQFLPQVLSMTDDQYVDFIKQKDVPVVATNVSVVDETEIPVRDSNRDKWRIKPNGKIEVDPSVKTKKELQNEKKTVLRSKLKNGQPLTDEDIDLLL